jgi:NTP pyrophosphatase (non-canonical NTP hydrolase)
MSYEQTELQVVMWGEKRGIVQNSDSKTQLLKAFSEMGELADAITKRDRDGIIDGIGDVLVCLTMVAAIEDVDVKQCFASAYDQIKDRKGYLNKEGVFIKDA